MVTVLLFSKLRNHRSFPVYKIFKGVLLEIYWHHQDDLPPVSDYFLLQVATIPLAKNQFFHEQSRLTRTVRLVVNSDQ